MVATGSSGDRVMESSAIIAELRNENSLLHEQLRIALEALRGTDDWLWPRRHHIGGQMELILRCLYKHYPNICSHEMLYLSMYVDRLDQDWPESRILQVQMCKLRHCLPNPDFIITAWGRGYHLSPEGKAWIEEQLRKQHKTNGKS